MEQIEQLVELVKEKSEEVVRERLDEEGATQEEIDRRIDGLKRAKHTFLYNIRQCLSKPFDPSNVVEPGSSADLEEIAKSNLVGAPSNSSIQSAQYQQPETFSCDHTHQRSTQSDAGIHYSGTRAGQASFSFPRHCEAATYTTSSLHEHASHSVVDYSYSPQQPQHIASTEFQHLFQAFNAIDIATPSPMPSSQFNHQQSHQYSTPSIILSSTSPFPAQFQPINQQSFGSVQQHLPQSDGGTRYSGTCAVQASSSYGGQYETAASTANCQHKNGNSYNDVNNRNVTHPSPPQSTSSTEFQQQNQDSTTPAPPSPAQLKKRGEKHKLRLEVRGSGDNIKVQDDSEAIPRNTCMHYGSASCHSSEGPRNERANMTSEERDAMVCLAEDIEQKRQQSVFAEGQKIPGTSKTPLILHPQKSEQARAVSTENRTRIEEFSRQDALPEDRQQRLELRIKRNRERNRAAYAALTTEQKKELNQKKYQNRRAKMSEEERQAQNANRRMKNQEFLAKETPAAREERLAKLRDYFQRRWAKMDPEKKKVIKKKNNERREMGNKGLDRNQETLNNQNTGKNEERSNDLKFLC